MRDAPVAVRPQPQPPRGVVALRLLLFASPAAELRDALRPPWPRWMRRLYEMEERSDPEIDAEHGETSVAAAVSALAARLRHRLEIVAFTLGVLQELGFEVELFGEDALLARARMTPHEARRALESAGVAGPMSNVCELDDSGWPRLWYGGDG